MADHCLPESKNAEAVTDLDRIASHCGCTRETMATYDSMLNEDSSVSDLLHMFSLSSEFKHIVVCGEETQELDNLRKQVVIPINEDLNRDERSKKVDILLQAFISQQEVLSGKLPKEMAYITHEKYAGKLVRVIFEICLYKGWARLIDESLTLCKMVERRNGYIDISTRPNKGIRWDLYYDPTLSPQTEIGKLIKMPTEAEAIGRAVRQVPKLKLSAHVQPVSRTLLQVELTIESDFEWNDEVHGNSQPFWVFVEDVDRKFVLHSEYFLLEKKYCEEKHVLKKIVPVSEPWPRLGKYYIRAVSDRWLAPETRHEVLLGDLIPPKELTSMTKLLDPQPLTVDEMELAYKDVQFTGKVTKFNRIQTQVFKSLYETDDNVFVGAPMGSDKFVCAEFAILRAIKNQAEYRRCVYVAPNQARVDQMHKDWSERFGRCLSGKVVKFTGENTADMRLLREGFIVLVTLEQWDMLSRRCRQRINVQNGDLFIVDDLHMIGGESGPVLEVVCSRMLFMSTLSEMRIRIVALSSPVANPEDLGEWLGVKSEHLFNFSPSARPIPLKVHIQGFSSRHAHKRLKVMAKPLYTAINRHSPCQPVMVFVPSPRQTLQTAHNLVKSCDTERREEGRTDRFLLCSPEDIVQRTALITDETLREVVIRGVGYLHEGLSEVERKVVRELFTSKAIQVLVVSRNLVCTMDCKVNLVIVMDTQYYDDQKHRYVDYPVTDVLQMVGLAEGSIVKDKCVLMCQNSRKDFYTKVLSDPLPVESRLDHFLHNHFNTEIVTGTIKNKKEAVGYLTRTFLYRRMTKNPIYYNLRLQAVSRDDHIRDLVDRTLKDLKDYNCIDMKDDGVTKPLYLGKIASQYCINYTTIDGFSQSLTEETTLKDMIEIISLAAEYKDLPMRHGENSELAVLASRGLFMLPAEHKFTDPHIKANLLLQARMSRKPLSPELQSDTECVLKKMTKLLQACVAVLRSRRGRLDSVQVAMHLSQMATQAVRHGDSVLLQLPHFTYERMQTCQEEGVRTIYQLMEVLKDKEKWSTLFDKLKLPTNRDRDVENYCKYYPEVEMNVEYVKAKDNHRSGVVVMDVTVQRTSALPPKREEVWWLVVGENTSKFLRPPRNVVAAAEQLTFHESSKSSCKVHLEFAIAYCPKATYELHLVCSSYRGCDKQLPIRLY